MLAGVLRRFVWVHFRRSYVREQLAARQGDCRQCGVCCGFFVRCPVLTKSGRCLVYGKCRPLSCKEFPLDRKDLEEVAARGGKCGYRFDGER